MDNKLNYIYTIISIRYINFIDYIILYIKNNRD